MAVSYTPDATAEPVADLAMGMIVAVMRRLCEADRFVRAGKWPAGVFDSGREVRGKTCGIVGMVAPSTDLHSETLQVLSRLEDPFSQSIHELAARLSREASPFLTF